MSEFYDMLADGMDELLDQMEDKDGGKVMLKYGTSSAPVIPAGQQKISEARRNGLWETGDVLVEMKRNDFERLKLEDKAVVKYGPREASMKVKIIDDDPSDPAVRLTLKVHNG